MKLALIDDPERKTTTHMEFLPDGRMQFTTTQKVPHGLLMHNASLANENKGKSMIGDTQRHRQYVAEIPQLLYYKWLEELGDPAKDETAAKKWKQRLNDPAYRYLRTGGGRL